MVTNNASGARMLPPTTLHGNTALRSGHGTIQLDALGAGRRSIFPSVYVYNLSHRLETGEVLRVSLGFPHGSPGCEALPHGSSEEDDCLFGTEHSVYSPGIDQHIALRATGTFWLGRIMQRRLTASVHRVFDAEEADLFFIPIWREPLQNHTDLHTCPSAEKIVSLLPFLNEKTAARHFFISPRTGIIGMPSLQSRGYDVCPALQDFKHIQHPNGSLTAQGLLARTTKVATEDVECCAGHWGHWAAWSTPCPNVGSGLNLSAARALRVAASWQLPRTRLVMASMGIHGKQAALRAAWMKQCRARPVECDSVDFRTNVKGTFLGQDGWGRVLSARLNATFCLEPYGDSPTRKSVSDSLLLGCIPVLSSPDQRRVWHWHTGARWDEFSLLHASSNGVIERLMKVPQTTIDKLRRGGQRVALHLSYAPEEGRADAVESILAGVHRSVGRSAAE